MRAWSAKNTRKRAERQARDMAQDTGGSAHKASGSLPYLKSDGRKSSPEPALVNINEARARQYRSEDKFTRAKSFPVKLSDLEKLRGECRFDETPSFSIQFLDANGRPIDKWVCIPYADWVKNYKKE